MEQTYPGPNPAWGELYPVRDLPLDFIRIALTLTEEALAKVRFTSHFLLQPSWGVNEFRLYRGTPRLEAVDQIRFVTPTKGTVPTYIYDANGLLAWVEALTKLKYGNSQQQDRDLYRMVVRHWQQSVDYAANEPFMSVVYQLRAYAGLAALEALFPAAPYTAKARDFLAAQIGT